MSKRFLCDDCKWDWRSCKHRDYPNASQCTDYMSKGMVGEAMQRQGNTDKVDKKGRIWRGDKYWDSSKGWIRPSLFNRVFKL